MEAAGHRRVGELQGYSGARSKSVVRAAYKQRRAQALFVQLALATGARTSPALKRLTFDELHREEPAITIGKQLV